MTNPTKPERLEELARPLGRYPASWDEPWKEPLAPISADLRDALKAAHERTLAMTPAERQAMFEAQRQSFIRAMGPCEHGDPDWETCPECRAQASALRGPGDE